jgi:DNA anti-recombination protein RmuC
MRRVEIVEDGIDSTVTRMDKFMATLSLDSERASKLEAALKDQVEVIGHINERVKLQGNQQEALTDQVEQRLQVVRTEINGRLDGNIEALKKGISFLETDLNGMKKAASQNATDLSEFKATVERGFEETLNKQRDLNTKVLQDLNEKVDTHEENVETIRKDFEGFNFKHKQAI